VFIASKRRKHQTFVVDNDLRRNNSLSLRLPVL